jgi:hypothetical protein
LNFCEKDIAQTRRSTKIAESRIQVQDFKVFRSQMNNMKQLAMVYLLTSRYKLPKKTFCPGSNSKSAVAPLAFEIADLTPGNFFCIIYQEFASVPGKISSSQRFARTSRTKNSPMTCEHNLIGSLSKSQQTIM